MRNFGKLSIKKMVLTDALLFLRIICHDQSRDAQRLIRFVMSMGFFFGLETSF